MKRLKNPMPFRKAIYDIYFSKKVSDLVNNVVGKEKVSGIYKITEIESGRVYVGKSVNIGERWKEHIKRGAGAVPLTQNKLYPAMIEKGIENYTFEVLETTKDVERLSEMERYWQDFFKAREFGYSMR